LGRCTNPLCLFIDKTISSKNSPFKFKFLSVYHNPDFLFSFFDTSIAHFCAYYIHYQGSIKTGVKDPAGDADEPSGAAYAKSRRNEYRKN
jgi:hypothetical protein